MRTWRELCHGARVLFRRNAADRDLDDELRHYFEEAAAEEVANGAPADEARRVVQLAYGTPIAAREEVRGAGWEHAVDTMAADLRYAVRGLCANPGFTAVAVLTLALGIGATTAIFSAAKPVLFESLPYPDASRVAAIWDRAGDGSSIEITFGTYRELLLRARTLQSFAAMKPWQPTLVGGLEPERLDGQRVSAPYFSVLGVRPAVGRDFVEEDDRPNAPGVVIISDGLWRRRFGADPAIVDRTITLNDARVTVIGVMPADFENLPREDAEIWAPLQYDPALPANGREWGHHLQAIARIRGNASVGAARAELDTIARNPIAAHPRMPWAALQQGLVLRSLQADVTSAVRPALVAVLGAAAVVLAIACVNVTNLLLARGARRRDEFAMRAALGASRSRLVRQLLTESLLLAAVGGGLGVAVAHAGIGGIVALSPLRLPRFDTLRIDASVLMFALAVTSAIGVVIGVVPALQASRARPRESAGFVRTARTGAGGHRRTRSALVIAEVALTIVLLVSTGLLVRSLQRLFAVDAGFDPARLLTMQVQISSWQFDDADAVERFFARALDAVRRLPGVTAAGFTTQLPMSTDFEKYGTRFESSPTEPLLDDHSALRYAVSPGYIEMMRIPLRRGRLFTERDVRGMPPVAVINEAFANRRFPGMDPIGQRLHVGRSDRWITIVGVVGDTKQTSLALAQSDAVYLPASQWYAIDRVRSLVVRTKGEPLALAAAVRQAIWSVDKDQPIVRVATMDALLASTASERRFALLLFELFAIAALALAVIGIYGVLSGSVTERVREIGVRAALGASKADILRLIMRSGMLLTGAGVALGLVAAALASRALVTLLFGVSALDPATYALVVVAVAAVSAAACGVPAWRAVQIDPSVTLRAE